MADTTLEIYRGDSKAWDCTFTQSGAALDVRGMILYFTAKVNPEDEDSAAVIDTHLDIPSDAEAQAGRCVFTLATTDTDIDVGTYSYDFVLVSGSSVTTLGKGKLKILLRVNKDI